MNLIAIETATENCSVALWINGKILERSEIAPRRQTELVLPMIAELLAEAGLSRKELHAVAVGRGPGAFTGVRLAISVAQGLALGLNIPVLPISSLAALAMDVPTNEGITLTTIDARMGEIYSAVYQRTSSGAIKLIDPENICSGDKLFLPKNEQWNVIGSGWSAYRTIIEKKLGSKPLWADGNRFPQARHIAQLAAAEFKAGRGVAPEAALPVYLRDKVALTLQEQQQQSIGLN